MIAEEIAAVLAEHRRYRRTRRRRPYRWLPERAFRALYLALARRRSPRP